MAVYESDPSARPDSDFEPGTLRHLAPGACGRLLDARRTSVTVLEVRPAVGFVDVRIEAFEDAGAVWTVPLEDVEHYQFEPGGPRADATAVSEMEAAIERLARQQSIEVTAADGRRTEAHIERQEADAKAWLSTCSRFLAEGRALPDPSSRHGDPLLAGDLEAYLRRHDLWDLEAWFSKCFVSNPRSGELVKGHRIVLAECGLARYEGSTVRDPTTFAGGLSKDRRAEHIVARMAFLRAFFALMSIRSVTLWRGLSTTSGLHEPSSGRSFVSTSFDEAVARAHYDSAGSAATRVIVGQLLPVEHLFMTYLETAAMNDPYQEAEAVVLARPGDRWP